MYLVFTRMQDGSYRKLLESFLSCSCNLFRNVEAEEEIKKQDLIHFQPLKKKTIALKVKDRFIIQQSTRQSLEYIPGAGIRVLNVTAADSGTYSELVTISVNGSTVSHVQSVNVVVTGKNQTHVMLSVFL